MLPLINFTYVLTQFLVVLFKFVYERNVLVLVYSKLYAVYSRLCIYTMFVLWDGQVKGGSEIDFYKT